jgi:hypothetical protein
MKVVKPADLKIGDVVCYYCHGDGRMPFSDMRVISYENDGVHLRRPYINTDGEAACEELWFALASNFPFWLVYRAWQPHTV